MIIKVSPNISKENLNIIKEFFHEKGLTLKDISTDEAMMYLITGETYILDEQSVLMLPDILSCTRISPRFNLVARKNNENKVIKVGDLCFGSKEICVIAGPCSIESYDQLSSITSKLKKITKFVLRGGAFKPRTSPYYFQGLGKEALEILSKVKKEYGVPTISEITDKDELDSFSNVDILQVGARNMQNYELLKALGKQSKPVLLKRGPQATIEEFLLSAEYIVKNGNPNVILCERGIRSFDKNTRYILDLSAIPVLKKMTDLPIIVDPSHALGDYNLIEPMILASISAGCDGIMVEVHDKPWEALSDGKQALKIEKFNVTINKAKEIAKVIGRELS